MPSFTLMIQGTTSSAGKSFVTAAFCRLLHRQGVGVAPFKPQNMSLNSAVTPEGGEIGRAQAFQARGAGLAPHTDMNPILLKPNSDVGSQIIVNGQPIGNMNAKSYQQYKPQLMSVVLAAHARLAARHEVIIVEGAGSPAEINLRTDDLANMGFAEAIDCPVILVGDIDRGGIFAHFVGTLALLSPSEQERVIGFIINKFRGDIALLEPGLSWLEEKTGKPVLGVLPMVGQLSLPEEDGFFAPRPRDGASHPWPGRVVVPRLPRLSNHTDLDPVVGLPGVEVVWVEAHQPLPAADLILLPGSKSVRADLAWLREQGWEAAIQRHLRYGGKVLGICGGFQMLGTTIHDPAGLEGVAGSSPGLGLLPMETTITPHKQLCQQEGQLLLGQRPARVAGYEIHMGLSTGPALRRPALRLQGERDEGAISADGQVMGSYLHGLMDHPEALAAILAWAGLPGRAMRDLHAEQEKSLERLADLLEEHIQWDFLQSLVATGKGLAAGT
ncbi:MAG: cobyric acid synthase [Magnetococcales bacterium]|nr:cobyric acid synthase [Magnetococcales bacterium]